MPAPEMAPGLRAGKEAAMQALEKKKEYHSSCAVVGTEKPTQDQKGPLMERPEEGDRGTQAPRARHSGSIRGSLRSVGIQHVIKEEPEEETAQIWETQWQDFLSTVEVSPSLPQDPHFPPESTPWDDAQAFLASFEQVAEACRWPREEWVDRLRPALTGEAELTFSSLEDGDKEDYGKVKAAILQEDVLGREKSRQHFRSFCYQEAEGPRGAYGRLRELCSRWLKVEKHSKEQILEELVLEQFLAVLPSEIQAWVKEHPLKSSTQAVSLAEEFLRSQWVPGVKEEQAAQLYGGGPAHLPEGEGLPQSDGEGLRLPRESKTEDLTDFSDADLSADGGEVYEDHETHPEESSHPRAPQGISLGRASDNGPQFCHQENGRRKERPPGSCTAESGRDLICREAYKNTRKNVCSVCGKSFTRKWALNQHKIKHHLSQSSEETPRGFLAREDGRDKTNIESQQRIPSGEHPCVCSHCGESFSSKLLLMVHQRTHVEDQLPLSLPEVTLYICRECGETFSCLQDHDTHQAAHTRQRRRAVVEHEEETEQPSSLTKPSRPPAEERPYKCTDCGKSFVLMFWYKRHQLVHRRKKQASFFCKPKRKICSVCGSAFSDSWKLRRHQQSHRQMNADQGAQRKESLKWNVDLRKRGRAPETEKTEPPTQKKPGRPGKSFPCSQCGKNFRKLAHLVRHQSSHSTRRPYACAQCGKRFKKESSLCDHNKNCHKGKRSAPLLAQEPLANGRSAPCPDCGKRFCSMASLQRHKRMHSGEKFYRCVDCGASFLWDSTFYSHRRKVHQWQGAAHPVQRVPNAKKKKKTYLCNQCGATFKQASHLTMHQCVHAESKPFLCADCGRSFSDPSSLKRHQRNHQKATPESLPKEAPRGKEKPFVCAECGKSFELPGHLKMHQRIHLTVKPLKCDDCGERFLWKVCLARHRKKTHGRDKTVPLSPATPGVQEGALSCHDCGKSFAKKPDLVKHQRIHATKKPLKHTDCGKSFQGRFGKDRKDHSETQEKPPGEKVSGPKQKMYTCLECGADFTSVPDLVSHGYIHGGGKLYTCMDCGKNFAQSSSLGRHQREIHKGKKLVPVVQRMPELEKKPYKCPDYEKSLREPLDTLRYQATPEKGKAHTCSECGEYFSFRTSLLKHQAIHREVRQHTCCECGKKFFHQNSLTKHKMTHARFQKLTLQIFGSDLQVTGSSSSPPPAVTLTHENSKDAPPVGKVEASDGPAPVEDPPLELPDQTEARLEKNEANIHI